MLPGDDPAFVRWVQEQILGPMQESALTTVLWSDPDWSLALQVGAAVCFDKPMIVVQLGGVAIPPKLAAIADAVIEVSDPAMLGSDEFQAVLWAALRELGLSL